jgi:predicted Fe-Mo cluster-binding NifX family protein
MKIAIAVDAADTEAQIDERGARAPYFLIIDSASGESEILANPAAQVERAAGPKAAAFLQGIGVVKVVAGDFGPKFRDELENSGIASELASGAASQVIRVWRY